MKSRIKGTWRSVVALILSAAILLPTLAACKDNESGTNTGTIPADVQASYVTWTESGEYTTSLTAGDVDLSDVTAADVTVTVPDPSGTSSDGQAEKQSCPVKKVEQTDDALEITFTDENAAKKTANNYTVVIEKKNLSTPVMVDYPAPSVTLEGSGVLQSEEDPEITLTLDSGLFAEAVTADQISLAGSFSGMEVANATAQSNQLKLQLKGKTEKPEGQNTFVDGILIISPSAMENERVAALVRVPIQQSLITFDSAKMTVNGTTVTAPLTVVGEADLDSITASDLTFLPEEEEERPAVTVQKVEKTDETTLTVTMEVAGLTDKNSAAKALDGRTAQLKGAAFLANFHPASIYPTFDYVEEDGEDLTLRLLIDAQNGTFADDLSAGQVRFDEDFADAKVVSLERENETSAALTLSVPSNGQTKEEFIYDGAVILDPGALINPWGDKTDEPTEYFRQYSQESLGRMSLGTYEGIARGLGITNGVLMGATAAFGITMMALEMSGAVKTTTMQLQEINERINKNLDDTFDVIKQNAALIDDIENIFLQKSINDFNLKLAMLNTYNKKFQHYLKPGMLALLGYDNVEAIEETDSTEVKVQKLKRIQEVIQDVFEAEDSKNDTIAHVFRDFFNTYTTMRNYYNDVCALLKATGDTNPINAYSKLLARTTNFDTIAYKLKNDYIDAIRSSMLVGYSNIFTFNLRSTTINNDGTVKMRAITQASEDDYNLVSQECDKVLENNQNMSITEVKTDGDVTYYDKAYCYTFGAYVEKLDSAHSDIFWSKTWRGKDKDGICDNSEAATAYAKGAAVFAYSHNPDYEKIIEETSIAPSYIATNYNWGAEMFSSKAPEGFDADAICTEKTEELIAGSVDKFVQRMNGRTLREELQLAGILVDDDIFKETDGLPFASIVGYDYDVYAKSTSQTARDRVYAKSYVNMIKWDEKVVTKLVPAAQRIVRTRISDVTWRDDWLKKNGKGIGGMEAAAYWADQLEKYKDSYSNQELGDENLIPIVRWVLETPGEDGTSPARGYNMFSGSEETDEENSD